MLLEIAIPQPAGNIEGKIILMRSFKDTSYPHIHLYVINLL